MHTEERKAKFPFTNSDSFQMGRLKQLFKQWQINSVKCTALGPKFNLR